MSFNVIIPARYASQRLPGKPLLDLAGKPMIQRVYEQAKASDAKQVIVATDHQDIVECVKNFGGEVVMTRTDHDSGTDRLAEVVQGYKLEPQDIVVNVQGDEPLIPPQVINQVANNLSKFSNASVATVSEPVIDMATYLDPNSVKVVSDDLGFALYFSRAPIPWYRDGALETATKETDLSAFLQGQAVQKHIGIYAYRCALLTAFSTWRASSLEETEKLEQLRILAQGHRIHVEPACHAVPGGIDTPEDLVKIRALLESRANV